MLIRRPTPSAGTIKIKNLPITSQVKQVVLLQVYQYRTVAIISQYVHLAGHNYDLVMQTSGGQTAGCPPVIDRRSNIAPHLLLAPLKARSTACYLRTYRYGS